MNFACDSCRHRYSLPDERVQGKTVKIRCKRCGALFAVTGPEAGSQDSTRVVSTADLERLRANERSIARNAGKASPRSPSEELDDEVTRTSVAPWFVMVKGKQEGPLDERGLARLVQEGAVTPRTYFWRQSLPGWTRGEALPTLAHLFRPALPLDAQALFSDVEAPSPEPVATHAPKPAAATRTDSAPSSSAKRVRSADTGGGGVRAQRSRTGSARRRRAPVWKAALVVAVLLALPVGALYVLSELGWVPRVGVRQVAEAGQSIRRTGLTSHGLTQARDILLGVRPGLPGAPPPEAVREAVQRVVAEAEPDLRRCVDEARRAGPLPPGPRVTLRARVSASGGVISAALDRPELERSALGGCLVRSARRMAFPADSGAELEVEIPVPLGSGS